MDIVSGLIIRVLSPDAHQTNNVINTGSNANEDCKIHPRQNIRPREDDTAGIQHAGSE